jgi:hypothetical protein
MSRRLRPGRLVTEVAGGLVLEQGAAHLALPDLADTLVSLHLAVLAGRSWGSR